MIINSDITIYNKKYNPETRTDTWHRTNLEGVHVHIDNKVSVTEKGLANADIFKIRVPADVITDKIYLSRSEFIRKADLGPYWTISKGDVIAMGNLSTDIEKPSDLSNLGVEFCTVLSFSDNRHGTLPHFRIEGV